MESRIYLAATLVAKGNRGAAEWEADEIRVGKPNFSMRDWLKTYPLTSPREIQKLLDLTARLQL